MATATPTARSATRFPRWPGLVLGLYAMLATVSILQGVVDIFVPTLRGQAPFGFLFLGTRELGPAFFALYVFAHNLGLACLVPGAGFVAARFEKRTANRGLIGILLGTAVVASLGVGIEYVLQSSDRFDLALALPLFAAEALGVLALAVPAAMQLRGFVPTRVYEWSLVHPLRKLALPFAASALVLAAASAFETKVVLGL